MLTITVHGPAPPLRSVLKGVPGSKNASMPIVVAAALSGAGVRVENAPALSDLAHLVEVLTALGVSVRRDGLALVIDGSSVTATDLPANARVFRGSIYAIAIPAVRFGHATMPMPGGDVLTRTLEPHTRAVRAFGMEFASGDGFLHINGGPPRASEFVLDDRGNTATGLAILLAAATEGRSVIRQASMEPENDDLLDAVRILGASAEREGRTIVIEGPMRVAAAQLHVPPDRLYCGTFMIAAAMTSGDLALPEAVAPRLQSVTEVLTAAGAQITVDRHWLRIRGSIVHPIAVETSMFPGFPTDLFPQIIAAATRLRGVSRLREGVYRGRFDHVDGLRRLGASVSVSGDTLSVTGPSSLQGTTVSGAGIRESTALVLAGLVSSGVTRVEHADAIRRGYEDLCGDLRALGAAVFAEERQ